MQKLQIGVLLQTFIQKFKKLIQLNIRDAFTDEVLDAHQRNWVKTETLQMSQLVKSLRTENQSYQDWNLAGSKAISFFSSLLDWITSLMLWVRNPDLCSSNSKHFAFGQFARNTKKLQQMLLVSLVFELFLPDQDQTVGVYLVRLIGPVGQVERNTTFEST